MKAIADLFYLVDVACRVLLQQPDVVSAVCAHVLHLSSYIPQYTMICFTLQHEDHAQPATKTVAGHEKWSVSSADISTVTDVAVLQGLNL